ncbi:MAG: hypothetical protein JWO08_3297 [Verrucomicrobiaceae bacterium]|nr:hypothetical protein [Verrucomicrobiaceae bacterium]
MGVRGVCPLLDTDLNSETQRQRYIVEYRDRAGNLHVENLAQDELDLVPESKWDEHKQEVPAVANADG